MQCIRRIMTPILDRLVKQFQSGTSKHPDTTRILLDKIIKTSRETIFTAGSPALFQVPWGYDAFHFAWYGEWAVELPKGYSALYIQPMNRYELPFETTSGIIDSDKVNLFGTVPFFIAKDFEGTLPKGTPFLQIIPFKRENWKSEYEYPDHMKIYNDNMENIKKYRTPKGGVYLNDVWERRQYK